MAQFRAATPGHTESALQWIEPLGKAKRKWRYAMQHYVGLDVSLKQTAVCVVDETGKVQRESMVQDSSWDWLCESSLKLEVDIKASSTLRSTSASMARSADRANCILQAESAIALLKQADQISGEALLRIGSNTRCARDQNPNIQATVGAAGRAAFPSTGGTSFGRVDYFSNLRQEPLHYLPCFVNKCDDPVSSATAGAPTSQPWPPFRSGPPPRRGAKEISRGCPEVRSFPLRPVWS
jgi:hypothetical protein